MCINLYTSSIAFLIGTVSSLFLIKNKNKEKRLIGYGILFYTLVQLLEALIYNDNNKIYSRLLLINLGLQGLVFILLLNNYIPINKCYIYISAIIAIYIIYKSIQPTFLNATTNTGMNWHFINNGIGNLLAISYIIVYIYQFIIIIVN